MICPVCNRPLKSPKSISKGIGPVCEVKVKKQKNNPPEGQMDLSEVKEWQSTNSEQKK
jgi:hypothetical protein